MAEEKDDGGRVFPSVYKVTNVGKGEGGMTLRQYAAIHLRVPDSGIEWLDAMIRKARKAEYAGLAMQGLLANEEIVRKTAELVAKTCPDLSGDDFPQAVRDAISLQARLQGDSLIAELKKP